MNQVRRQRTMSDTMTIPITTDMRWPTRPINRVTPMTAPASDADIDCGHCHGQCAGMLLSLVPASHDRLASARFGLMTAMRRPHLGSPARTPSVGTPRLIGGAGSFSPEPVRAWRVAAVRLRQPVRVGATSWSLARRSPCPHSTLEHRMHPRTRTTIRVRQALLAASPVAAARVAQAPPQPHRRRIGTPGLKELSRRPGSSPRPRRCSPARSRAEHSAAWPKPGRPEPCRP